LEKQYLNKFHQEQNTTLALADLSSKKGAALAPIETKPVTPEQPSPVPPEGNPFGRTGLHYNIQIHLPATKDVEVYNAIFKSLREHLFNE
jgi:hypothetical protein